MNEISFGTPDIAVVGVICFSILIGVLRGFVKESISLITWVIAIVLSITFASPLAEYMTFTKRELLRTLAAFFLIFVGTVFIGALINFVAGALIRRTPFSVPDRVLGSLFGFLRGIVFITLLVLLGGLTPLPETLWWKKSYTLTRFEVLALWVKDRLPEENAKVFHFSKEQKINQAKSNRTDFLETKNTKDNPHQ